MDSTSKRISKAEQRSRFFPEMYTEVSSTNTPQNIYIYIGIPASQPRRHMGSTTSKSTQKK